MLVYVTMRSCPEFTLTLGVFSSLELAKGYVEETATNSSDHWCEPVPGRQHWELQNGAFVYRIEEHDVR